MSAETFEVEVLSPNRVVTKTTVRQLLVPSTLGYLGILPGHAALIAELGLGELVLEEGKGKEKFFVAGGFIEVHNDKAKVLVDVVERPKDIDRERAQKARARALGRLNDKAVEIDMERAQKALARADARLAFLENVANLRMA